MRNKFKSLIVLTSIGLLLTACSASQTNQKTSKSSETTLTKKSALSNRKKAIAIIESFQTGDKSAFKKYVSSSQYIQHNLSVPDGRDVVMKNIEQLSKAGTKVKVVRSFEDGNYVVLHSEYQIAGGDKQAGFDIFRFKDGKAVEHWDNLQTMGTNNPSGHTLLDGSTKVMDTKDTEQNKALVKSFVETILVNKDLTKASDFFNGDNYIQHNPSTGDGVNTTIKGFQGLIDSNFDMQYQSIEKVLGSGNFVLVASQGTLMGQPTAYYDLFRVENGKIAEHWDTVDAIPSKDKWANQNGKF